MIDIPYRIEIIIDIPYKIEIINITDCVLVLTCASVTSLYSEF